MLVLFATKLLANIDAYVLQMQTMMTENKHKQKEIKEKKSIRVERPFSYNHVIKIVAASKHKLFW
jgi:hypothetical protein